MRRNFKHYFDSKLSGHYLSWLQAAFLSAGAPRFAQELGKQMFETCWDMSETDALE